jgi:serine/threonine-protein kinase
MLGASANLGNPLRSLKLLHSSKTNAIPERDLPRSGGASPVLSPRTLGRYRLIRRIARGGMGEVYLALMEAEGGVRKPVAVKVLLEGKPNRQAAFFAEARLAALIAHPNVAQLFDAGVDGELSWFVMEYVPGLPLSELLEFGRERVPPWIWARIVADACGALHAVHEARDANRAPLNVVHRDVTPQNVLLSWDGFVKLVDFGIARSALLGSQTTTGVVKGKVGYMSPEQAGGAPLDRRSDVFALGVVLWEALAGRRLFQCGTEAETIANIVRCDVPPLRAVAPDVPEVLADVVARALLPNAGARFSTAFEMKRALEIALSSSGFVVGTNEVAHLLATVASDRQREHERWLDAEPDTGAPQAPTLAAHELTRRLVGTSKDRRARPLLTLRFLAGAGLGAGVVAAAFALTRPSSPTAANSARATNTPREAAAAWRAASGATQAIAELDAGEERARTAMVAPSPPLPVNATGGGQGPAAPAKTARPDAASAASEPERGTLQIAAKPTWASVRLDGRSVGSTPLVVPDVPSGPHVLEVSAEGQGAVQQRSVVVRPGAVERVEISLE